MDRARIILVRFGLLALAGVVWMLACRLPQVRADVQADWFAELHRQSAAAPAVDAAGAVDGTINGGFGFHTDQQESPWWQVDLGEASDLDRIVVFNRTVAAERARTLIVRVSQNGATWQNVYAHDGTVFYGHQDQKPLTVPLSRVKARYVRLQVKENTWLHLDEVQLYDAADKDRNLAAGKPATQSSVSTWSRKVPVPAQQQQTLVLTDLELGQRVIQQLLEPCGLSATEPAKRLEQLLADGCPLDEQRWIALFSESRQLGQRWETVRQQWQRVNLESLRLAIIDLLETYGPRYQHGRAYLDQLAVIESQFPALNEAVDRGAREALAHAEEVLTLQRDALLANPLLDFERLLVVKRCESSPSLGLPANFNGNEALPRTGYDDELVVLSPLCPDGELTTLYHPGDNFVGDVDLDFRGKRLLFSSLDERKRWRIYEVGIDGSGLRKPAAD